MILKIGNNEVYKTMPVYFIADIASNHCGDLEKARELIYACSESGVDAVKMQNFNADSIVSDFGFRSIGNVASHQSKWKDSVYESYKKASIPLEWTIELKALTEELGMSYFTSPYSIELTRAVAPYVSAFKLGSGDITWHEQINEMASYNKPFIIATGASSLEEVKMVMNVALNKTARILLMQCNTSYTANKKDSEDQIRSHYSNINLRVLETYAKLWPNIPLGLSDHTHGSMAVLAAVGLFNCCAIEKHFTFDSSLDGQDHAFSMMPDEWMKMVKETAEIKGAISENASYEERYKIVKSCVQYPVFLDILIGDGVKKVEDNEKNTVVVQRRAIRTTHQLKAGHVLSKEDLIVLRPCPKEALPPYEIEKVIGKSITREIPQGDFIRLSDIQGTNEGLR